MRVDLLSIFVARHGCYARIFRALIVVLILGSYRNRVVSVYHSEETRMSLSARVVRSAPRIFVRHFPISRGKRRIVDTLAPLYASAGEDICLLPGGASIRVDPREHVQRFIYFFGAYERDSVDWLRKVLRAGMTVLDIGANVGQYLLIAASEVGPTGRVHGFEPTRSYTSV